MRNLALAVFLMIMAVGFSSPVVHAAQNKQQSQKQPPKCPVIIRVNEVTNAVHMGSVAPKHYRNAGVQPPTAYITDTVVEIVSTDNSVIISEIDVNKGDCRLQNFYPGTTFNIGDGNTYKVYKSNDSFQRCKNVVEIVVKIKDRGVWTFTQ